MAKIEFAWELGAHTGHVTTMLPVAAALKARGHEVRFLLREPHAAADLEGAAEIPREGAPIWSGPTINASPLNLGENLLNFGYHDAGPVKALIDAWREQLRGSQAVIANVAPAAHLAARTSANQRRMGRHGFFHEDIPPLRCSVRGTAREPPLPRNPRIILGIPRPFARF